MNEMKIEQARRHVREQEARIVKQEALIKRLEESRIPTDAANDWLGEMLNVLDRLKSNLDRLSR